MKFQKQVFILNSDKMMDLYLQYLTYYVYKFPDHLC